MTYSFQVLVSRVTMRQPTRKALQGMGNGRFLSMGSATEEKQEKVSFHQGGVERRDRDLGEANNSWETAGA